MKKMHCYEIDVKWTGNLGEGTSDYHAYSRAHEVTAIGKSTLLCSSDSVFHGDPERWNPEELLVAAVSQCHMLWYLHLCAVEGIVVTEYLDHAQGYMVVTPDGSGHFIDLVLRPKITIATPEAVDRAVMLHEAANQKCFIANSVNFPITHQPVVRADPNPSVLD
jgi:organic hydroperoxide reductase OsmC/OhrA